MWHVGQRVVCVKEFPLKTLRENIPVNKGTVYTIRDIISHQQQIGLKFYEIINKKQNTTEGYVERSYHEKNFKPLDEKRIDIFRAMLKDVKETEKV